MIRLLFLAALLGLFPGAVLARGNAKATPTPSAPPLSAVDFAHLPWNTGEALTYLICMGDFEAAQGTFVANEKGDHWEFDLALASRGLVDQFYPFSGSFWSILAPSPPWRSVEYGEFRFEPKRMVKERTTVDYADHKAVREIWIEGKTKTIPITQDALDDVGTMLYHLRAEPWKPGDKHTLYVYEHNQEKQGVAECTGHESRAFGIWPKQPLLRIESLPGKNTNHKGKLVFWITDDARHLPLHADLDFYYGSFSIDLTKAEGTLPAAP